MPQRMLQTAVVFLLLSSLACIPTRDSSSAAEHLPNFLAASHCIFSGAEPIGEEAFSAIASLGVQTIVSVDGVRPNIEEAARHGLRYVHIPIGYDGVSDVAQGSLTRLIREYDGAIYIHCHHGRHRGPAAAAIACQIEGSFNEDQAIAFLSLAGTDPNYTGLYRDVATFEPLAENAELPELVPIAQVRSLAEQMSKIERLVERMDEMRGETSNEDYLLLRQAFREASRGMETQSDFARLMRESERTVVELRESQPFPSMMRKLRTQCVECHRQFRDGDRY